MPCGRCFDCKYYLDKGNSVSKRLDYTCSNKEAFKYDSYMNDLDGETVLMDVSWEKIMIPLNFGCIHWEKKEESVRYDYEDDEDENY